MSLNDSSSPQSTDSTAATAPHRVPPIGRILRSQWTWMVLAATLLAASGGVRAWQDHRFGTALRQNELPPFALKELPKDLGDWKLQDGSDAQLDEKIARVAGCSDHIIRTYLNQRTGVGVTLLVLYGRSSEVAGHTPQICYPSAGYVPVASPLMRELPDARGSAVFRSDIFSKGGSREIEEVYHSFLYGGQWTPNAWDDWKNFRHHPYVFKVQTQRRVAARERRDVNNPSEQFLAVFLPELDRLLTPEASRRKG